MYANIKNWAIKYLQFVIRFKKNQAVEICYISLFMSVLHENKVGYNIICM